MVRLVYYYGITCQGLYKTNSNFVKRYGFCYYFSPNGGRERSRIYLTP
jgi:hypothetical protein